MAKTKKNKGWRKHDPIGVPVSERLRTFSGGGEGYDRPKFMPELCLKRKVASDG